jgi:hypothetical protein
MQVLGDELLRWPDLVVVLHKIEELEVVRSAMQVIYTEIDFSKLAPHQRREAVLRSPARNRETSVRACIRGGERLAEHMWHAGLLLAITVLPLAGSLFCSTLTVALLEHLKPQEEQF